MCFLRALPESWRQFLFSLRARGRIGILPPLKISQQTTYLESDVRGLLADHEKDQQLCFDDLDQLNKQDLEEYDLKHQMAMLSIRVRRFEKKAGRKIKFKGKGKCKILAEAVDLLIIVFTVGGAQIVSTTCIFLESTKHLIKDCDYYEKRLDKGRGSRNNDSKRKTPIDVSADRYNPISADTPISAEFPNSADTCKPICVDSYNFWLKHLIPAGMLFQQDLLRNRNVSYLHLLIGTWTDPALHFTRDPTPKKSSSNYIGTKFRPNSNPHLCLSDMLIRSIESYSLKMNSLISPSDFKLTYPSMVLFTVPRRHNLYTFSLNDFSSQGNITCLLAKASVDESTKWHRRLGHVNFKNMNMNKLVTGNLVRGLPSKLFQNDHTCVACNKGKQHRASYKRISAVSLIHHPLHLLHMDLFGPVSV
ncbi:putative ribonuclease H-like domain-containing protein [Tanacetum coccineum]